MCRSLKEQRRMWFACMRTEGLPKILVRVFGFCPQDNSIREGHAQFVFCKAPTYQLLTLRNQRDKDFLHSAEK